ncbi:MAG: DUF1580 domain-containing protein [Acidimicrobiia bacterium]|nr:DUF1580 domain-containing protein [Acidimicrobiia bacterium]
MSKVPTLLPGRPGRATCYRWTLKGCNGVRLEAIKIGRRLYTSHEALGRFVTAMTESTRGRSSSSARSPRWPRSHDKRGKDSLAAEALLRRRFGF